MLLEDRRLGEGKEQGTEEIKANEERISVPLCERQLESMSK